MPTDEDDEGKRMAVPLAPLGSFFSDGDSLKQQKKKKPKKMKEGKMPKVKKRKKEVKCYIVAAVNTSEDTKFPLNKSKPFIRLPFRSVCVSTLCRS